MSKDTAQLPSRRSFIKSVGSVGIGATIFSTGVTAEPGDKASSEVSEGDTFEERIRKSDPSELYETYARFYSSTVAEEVTRIWKHYTQAVLDDKLTRNEAINKFFAEIKQVSPDLRHDLEAAQAEFARVNAKQGTKITVEAPIVDENLSTQDLNTIEPQYTGEVLYNDGAVGGSGVGFRDSHYYLNQDILTSIVEITPAGSITQWAEFQGAFYIGDGDGGTYRATADYWHNGMLVGGSASYQMWIQPRGSSGKTFFELRSPSSSVHGNESRSVQMTLSGDQVYDFGFRLTTAINGISHALVDYQTVNADGSTRQLKLNSLTLNPI